jgi:sugar phosphate isomerase/epimerase
MQSTSAFGDRLIVSPSSSPKWTLEQDLALFQHLGLTQIETSTAKMAAVPREQWKSSLANAGVGVHTLALTIPAFDLTQPRTWEGTQQQLIAALDMAAELDATQCVLATGCARGRPFEKALTAFATAIAPVTDAANGHGLRLITEPVRPQFAQFCFIHSFADAVQVSRATGVGVSFDVVHLWWEAGLANAIRANADVVGLVQLSDLVFSGPIIERIMPGDGELPLAELIGYFLEAGYTGVFDLELIGSALEQEGYESAITRSYDYVSKLHP